MGKKRCIYRIILCLGLAACMAAPALADDAGLLDAVNAGKTIALVPAEISLSGAETDAVPVGISPDGSTVIGRSSAGTIFFVRDGQVIPVTAAPERGAGDPWNRLEKELASLKRVIPDIEGFSWSPDGRYLLLTSLQLALQKSECLDLMMVDTRTGEAFQEQAYLGGSMEQGTLMKALQDPAFGMVIEARFDASGEYIFMIARIHAYSESYSLYRYSLSGQRTELLLEDLKIARVGRMLYEMSDGSWLVMVSSKGASSPDSRDLVIRYRPDGTGPDRLERGVLGLKIRNIQASYSSASGYGLILVCSPAAGKVNYAAQASVGSDALPAKTFVTPELFTTPRLNRITPEGIDLDSYWEPVADPEAPAGIRFTELSREAVDLITRYILNEEMTPEEKETLCAYSQRLTDERIPRVNCLCQSPGGRFALLNLSPDFSGEAIYCLMDLTDMAVYPVEAPEELGAVPYNSAMGAAFFPGMVWNDDGTLLILSAGSDAAGVWRLEAE